MKADVIPPRLASSVDSTGLTMLEVAKSGCLQQTVRRKRCRPYSAHLFVYNVTRVMQRLARARLRQLRLTSRRY